jgi:hypothetical protein
MTGRVVWNGKAPEVRTEVTLSVAAGVYAVRIVTEANTVTTTKISLK